MLSFQVSTHRTCDAIKYKTERLNELAMTLHSLGLSGAGEQIQDEIAEIDALTETMRESSHKFTKSVEQMGHNRDVR